MRIPMGRALLMILISGAITFGLRALPFVLFGGKRAMPPLLKNLAGTLPPAIMAVLVVYCLKSFPVQSGMERLAGLLSVAVVTGLHIWKRNTLLSVFLGTACYMLLVRTLA